LPEKIEIFRKFAWKKRHFLTRIHDPQISNETDAASRTWPKPKDWRLWVNEPWET